VVFNKEFDDKDFLGKNEKFNNHFLFFFKKKNNILLKKYKFFVVKLKLYLITML